jgi:hypothetical protein
MGVDCFYKVPIPAENFWEMRGYIALFSCQKRDFFCLNRKAFKRRRSN